MSARPHDVGGQRAGPLDLAPRREEDWHTVVMALYAAAIDADPPLLTAHEYRRAMEALDPAVHRGDYHVRAVETLIALCAEKGLLTRAELEARAAEAGDG